jgi:hypothetical protein
LSHAHVGILDRGRQLQGCRRRRGAHVLERHRGRHAQLGVGVHERRREVGHGGASALSHSPERVRGGDPIRCGARAQHLGERRHRRLAELQQLETRLAAHLRVGAAHLVEELADVWFLLLRAAGRKQQG